METETGGRTETKEILSTGTETHRSTWEDGVSDLSDLSLNPLTHPRCVRGPRGTKHQTWTESVCHHQLIANVQSLTFLKIPQVVYSGIRAEPEIILTSSSYIIHETRAPTLHILCVCICIC